jgi:hypothetical protein
MTETIKQQLYLPPVPSEPTYTIGADFGDIPSITVMEIWDVRSGLMVKRRIGDGPWEDVSPTNQMGVKFR